MTRCICSNIVGVAADEWELGGHAGVGHHDVESAERLGCLVDHSVDLLPISDVAAPPRNVDAASGLRQQVGLEPGERDPGAPLVQALGEGGADAAGRAGDEHAATAQSV